MNLDSIANAATVELASVPPVIPCAARLAFLSVHKVHRLWRWIRLGNIYRNPHHFTQLAAGHGLNLMIGNSALVKISAVSVLIATRILLTVSAYEKLQNSWIRLENALHDRYPVPMHCSWDQTHSFFSLSTTIWIKTTTKKMICRIQLIAISLFKVGKHTILLSLRLLDANEAFSLKPEICEEATNLIFVNGFTCLSGLVKNKNFLLENLESNQEIIGKILSGVGSQLTSAHLIDTVESSLEQIESFHQSAGGVNDRIGEFVSTCGKKWTYEFFRELGLRHLVPSSFIPPSTPPWEHPQRHQIKERFPPKNWLKKPLDLSSSKTPRKIKNLDTKTSSFFHRLTSAF